MSAINPTKAVDAFERLEAILKGVDPQLSQPSPVGIKVTLAALAVTREHAAAAMSVGQNVDALLMLACRQIAEAATTIRNIMLTMPAADTNAAAIQSLIEAL